MSTDTGELDTDEGLPSNDPTEAIRWRRAVARRAAMLVDASAYYAALRSSLLKAKRRVFLIGWDIDSRTPVRGAETPGDGAPETLGPLLGHLVEHAPELEIHVLLWDYSVLYALEREPIPRLNLDWRTPHRVHVCLDDELPLGSSHHEKLVIVDDAVAYCGGLDLTIRRWDTPDHRPGHTGRVDPEGAPYGPFHDVQMLVDGDAAACLGELARERWDAAAGTGIGPVRPVEDPWPAGVMADFADATVGIVRTRPEHAGVAALRQVEESYLRSIESAQRFIYIENQFLTAPSVAAALRRRLREVPKLELVIVNPRAPGGWLEAQTMSTGRRHFIDRLDNVDGRSRIRVLYPWVADNGERADVMVHSKVMVVDDSLLRVGSSNLNRRSMGVDSECDLLIEARNEAERHTICRLRRRLLAEHLGIAPGTLEAREDRLGSLVGAIDEPGVEHRGLAPLGDDDGPQTPWTETLAELADPERPVDPARLVGDLFGARRRKPLLRRAARFGILAAVVGAILAVWQLSPLSEWVAPERLEAILESIGASPFVGPSVVGIFAIGSLIAFPVTAMIAATAVALGPVSGFIWASVGCVAGAAASYALGAVLGRRLLANMLGGRVDRVAQRLRHTSIVSLMILRNVPIAPFTVINVVAGATAMRFRDYLIGTTLGMTPGIAAITIFGDRLRGVLEAPTPANLGLLVVAVALWLGIAVGLQSLSNRAAQTRD